MSGKWQWVPPGWRVVPEQWTDEMLDKLPGDTDCREATQGDIAQALAAAPEPPSGWTKGYPEDGRLWFSFNYGGYSVLGYWDDASVCAWWTEFPLRPEDKP